MPYPERLSRHAMRAAVACFLLACAFAAQAAPSDHFVTTWNTENPGTSSNTSITVPMVGGPYDVDWDNDGTFEETGLNGSVTHDFGAPGIVTIRIRGTYDSIRFSNDLDREKIVFLDQWGTNSWTTMERAFWGASNLEVRATDTPDFSAVSSMILMFAGATVANPDTSNWNTSNVTSMHAMFFQATVANPDTSQWDTSSVTDMSIMFSEATAANPDTTHWDTSNVTDMSFMFDRATAANPDTSNWNTSNVTSMRAMFQLAEAANPDTSQWDTAKVTDMASMFFRAASANPDTANWDTGEVTNTVGMFAFAEASNPNITDWNTANVTTTSLMFRGATSFDRDLGGWDVSALLDATHMFEGVALSSPNYDSLLVGWNAQALQPGVVFDGGNSVFCSDAAISARTTMIDNDGWTITDGGQCATSAPTPVPAIDRYGMLLLFLLMSIIAWFGLNKAMPGRA